MRVFGMEKNKTLVLGVSSGWLGLGNEDVRLHQWDAWPWLTGGALHLPGGGG